MKRDTSSDKSIEHAPGAEHLPAGLDELWRLVIVQSQVILVVAEPLIRDLCLGHVDFPDDEELREQFKDDLSSRFVAAFQDKDDALVHELVVIVRHTDVLQAFEKLLEILGDHVPNGVDGQGGESADWREGSRGSMVDRVPQTDRRANHCHCKA